MQTCFKWLHNDINLVGGGKQVKCTYYHSFAVGPDQAIYST